MFGSVTTVSEETRVRIEALNFCFLQTALRGILNAGKRMEKLQTQTTSLQFPGWCRQVFHTHHLPTGSFQPPPSPEKNPQLIKMDLHFCQKFGAKLMKSRITCRSQNVEML